MKKYRHKNLVYFLSGAKPNLLLLSGTHGDEYESIRAIGECLRKYQNSLPPFLYIPFVSPSAVKLQTRKNKAGLDINRTFLAKSKDRETENVMEIVSRYRFNLCVTFHEDPEQKDFYLYDSGSVTAKDWKIFKKRLKGLGVGMLNGVDDATDPILGNRFEDGYKAFLTDKSSPASDGEGDGTFWSWAVAKGLVKKVMTPEVPGKLPIKTKGKVVEAFFQEIIIPLAEKN